MTIRGIPQIYYGSEIGMTGKKDLQIDKVKHKSFIEVNEEGDNFRIKTETDNQLNYAIKLLNG